jgi:hypothetical protein
MDLAERQVIAVGNGLLATARRELAAQRDAENREWDLRDYVHAAVPVGGFLGELLRTIEDALARLVTGGTMAP